MSKPNTTPEDESKKNEIDLGRGATYIPKKVRKARKKGHLVKYIVSDKPFWLFRDGKRIYSK